MSGLLVHVRDDIHRLNRVPSTWCPTLHDVRENDGDSFFVPQSHILHVTHQGLNDQASGMNLAFFHCYRPLAASVVCNPFQTPKCDDVISGKGKGGP